jgi:hypothetical protein
MGHAVSRYLHLALIYALLEDRGRAKSASNVLVGCFIFDLTPEHLQVGVKHRLPTAITHCSLVGRLAKAR